MQIYEIYDFTGDELSKKTGEFLSLTDPASIRQIVSALKNEGFIKKGARFSSYTRDTDPSLYSVDIYRGDTLHYVLVPA